MLTTLIIIEVQVFSFNSNFTSRKKGVADLLVFLLSITVAKVVICCLINNIINIFAMFT